MLSRALIRHPSRKTPMSRRKLILLPSLLILAMPGWVEARSENTKAQTRPLNLSLPRDVLQAPSQHPTDEAVERNLHAPATPQGSKTPVHPAILPYGAGYEHRHQEMGGTGTGSGSSAGGGAGRRGR
jgi:hypothetical protein